MADKPMRKTQARVAERERRRTQEQRTHKLKTAILLVLTGALAVLGIGYATGALTAKPPRPANAGVTGPRLQLDREQSDLGRRVFDEPVRAVFNLKNMGDDALTLSAPRLVTALQGC